MAQMTLLEVVQDVMSDLSMDEIDSIEDTVESLQVANIVKGVWEEIQEVYDLNKRAGFFQLDATSTSTPTVLTIPGGVNHLESFEYDSRTDLSDPVQYVTIRYIEPLEFFRRSNALDETQTEVELISHSSGVTYKVLNDRMPSVYTIYNNKYILCDSYDSDMDTNLQQSKTRCLGTVEATWTNTDAYVIDLDNALLLLLREKSKLRTMSRLKGQRDADSERTTKRLENRAFTTKDKLRGPAKFPNFGRK